MADAIDMTERDAVLTRLRAALPELSGHWPIKSLGVFGSFARNDAHEKSDVDVLADFKHPIALSAFLALEDRLCAIAGRPVELVSRAALKPHMRRNVMRDLVLL